MNACRGRGNLPGPRDPRTLPSPSTPVRPPPRPPRSRLPLRPLPVALALFALALSPALAARATTVAHVTIEQLARASHFVAVVTVVTQRTRVRDGEIVTDVTVHLEAPVRGEAPASDTLTIVLPGGTFEGRTDTIDGAPVVRPGLSYLAFLRRLPADGTSVYFLTHLTAGLAPLTATPAGEVTVAPAPGLLARCDAPALCPPSRVLASRDTVLRFPHVTLPFLARALGQLR